MFSGTQKNVKPQLFVVLTIRICNEKKGYLEGIWDLFPPQNEVKHFECATLRMA